MSYYIGVIGPSKNYLFNDGDLKEMNQKIKEAMVRKEKYEDQDGDDNVYIVSSLIFEGITLAAYNMSQSLKMKFLGIDCTRSKSFEAFPHAKGITEKYITGDFGVENKYFVDNIDILIPIGNLTGNDRAKLDLARAKGIPVI